MAAYLVVYGIDPTDRLAAYVFPNRKAAWLASLPTGANLTPHVPPDGTAGGCACVIENEADVTFSGGLLVAIYNGLNHEGHVNRFESRTVGIQRLLALLPTIAVPPPGGAMSTQEQIMPETNETERRGRRPSLADSDVIVIVAAANPKRPGSKIHGKWERLVSGQTTVAQAHEIGFSNHDLIWDRDHGSLTINPAA